MNQQYKIEEIRQLEICLANHPLETDLMNQLAIAYLSCREVGCLNKAIELFKKAFDIQPSIKTSNNYAYQFITDLYDYKKGIEILQPFVDNNPKSFMPYNLIGYAYLMNENFEKAEAYFEKAKSLSPTARVEIIHNLAVCKNYLNKPQEALALYEKSIAIGDADNESKFNKAVCYIELGLNSGINKIIEEIRNNEAYKEPTAWVSNTDLSHLCYLINDMNQAYELIMENPNFELLSFPEFCYLLLKYNDSKLNELAEDEKGSKKSWIADLNNPKDENYDSYTEAERLNKIKELNDEIDMINDLRHQLINPPTIKPSDLYKSIFCGCMLYDCKIHETQFDD